jgi:hypothetical protein
MAIWGTPLGLEEKKFAYTTVKTVVKSPHGQMLANAANRS